jgi:uncharacterized protein (DUF4415 family)
MSKVASKSLSAAQRAQLAKLAAMKDADIDTSDAPEARDWRGAERGRFYRPVKKQLTLRIDADVVDWFKKTAPDGEGYQTRMNTALREYVQRRSKSA